MMGSRTSIDLNNPAGAARWSGLEVVPDATVVIDPSGLILFANAEAERLFGYPREEMIGRLVELLVPDGMRAMRVVRRTRLVDLPERYPDGAIIETVARRKDGWELPVELSVRPPSAATGDVLVATVRDRAHRSQTAAELHSSEAALAEAQRLAHIGSWEWNPLSNTVLWSAELYRILGLAPGECTASLDRFLSLVHPDDREDVAAAISTALNAQERFSLEHRIVRPDGQVRHLACEGETLSWGDGIQTRMHGTAHDITDRAVAEEAAKWFATIVDSCGDAITSATPDDVIASWNPAAERLFGYSPQEAIGQPITLIFPDHGSDPAETLAWRVLAGERVVDREVVRRRKDGSEIAVSLTLSEIRGRDGRVLGVCAVQRDITERRRAMDALAEAEERFRSAFDGAPNGMVISSLNARFMRVNDAFCAIVGYPREQLERMSFEAITHADDLALVSEPLCAMREGEHDRFVTEARYVHAGGRAVDVAMQVSLIRSADGTPAYFLTQVQDITSRKHYEEQLLYQADHDVLTGLLNRRAFARALEAHAAIVERYGPVGTILILDLDYFKYVNDTLGHQVGDELIVVVARLLAERLRSSDVLARLGGDEFGVLLPRADPASAEILAASLLEGLHSAPITVAGVECRVTASIGTSSFSDQPGAAVDEVLVNADLAMYDAKEAGRDRVVRFTVADQASTRMKGNVTWVQRIRAALENERFTLVAQPIVELHSGTVSQYELLLRMVDERGMLVAPEPFLRIAEQVDLIKQIDTWVVTHAIRQLAQLDPVHSEVAIELNLSGRSLGDPVLLELIEHELRAGGVAPERVIFEVTETAAVSSIPRAREFGERMSAIGCRFALDDFGAGFGTFYYLKHLTFDYVKIAGEFVRDCARDSTDQLVIKAIVDIARGMGKRTIAEFVGDDETVRRLAELGVDFGQGYHLGMPAPLAEQLGGAVRRGPLAAGGLLPR